MGRWNGAGGKVEPGENDETAMIRECQEEIGVTPQSFEKAAHLTFINKNEKNQPYTIIVHAYLCKKWKGEPKETEEMAPKWFNISKVPYHHMWEDDEFWLPQVLQGKKIIGSFEFDTNDHIINKAVTIVEKL